MGKKADHVTRRELLKGAAQMGLLGAIPPSLDRLKDIGVQKKGLISEENKREGTTDWQLTYVRSDNYRSKLIEGYCSKTSLHAGESLDIFLSAAGLSREKGFTTDCYALFFSITSNPKI